MGSYSTPSLDRDSRTLTMDLESTRAPKSLPIPGVKTHYRGAKKDFVASVVDYESEYEKVNSSMQLLWERVMEQGSYKTNSAYANVAVLLLSWDKDLDDMDIKDEVDSLERVFKDDFNYKVYNKCISKIPNKSAQNQVNHHVADFIYEEDGPNNLLIVYYAGHGKPGSGHGYLELAGKSSPFELQNTLETAVWNWAEAALQGTEADVLEILDCCYAGNLGGSRGVGTRSFECLAATSSGSLTRRPGKASFTSALIWALLSLSKEHGRFDTVELVNKIRHEAPDFPRHQVPLLIERNDASSTWRHIMLTPFSRGESPNIPVSKDFRSLASANQESLSLKFIFETRPTPEQIEKLGNDLNIIMMNNHFHVSRIAWGGLHRYIFAQAASRFLNMGLRRRQKSSPSITPSESPDPSLDPMASWPMHTSATTHEELPSQEMLRDAYHLGQKYESARLGIVYHMRMLLICIWVSIAFLGTSLPFKGRGLIFLSSMAVASWCAFVTLKESIYV